MLQFMGGRARHDLATEQQRTVSAARHQTLKFREWKSFVQTEQSQKKESDPLSLGSIPIYVPFKGEKTSKQSPERQVEN